jgi:hypothetical protein
MHCDGALQFMGNVENAVAPAAQTSAARLL